MMASKKIGAAAMTAVLALGLSAFADAGPAARYDSAIQQAVAHKLENKAKFGAVRVSVEDGAVTLRGSVPTFADKLNAEKAARKTDHVTGVRDLVEVSAPAVSDSELSRQVASKLRYVGFNTGTQVFDAFQASVQDGVVTVSGETFDGYDKDQALDALARLKGVKGIVDQIKVAPTSTFDDAIRLHLVRALYGGEGVRYGIDPQAPIRIVVDNGHVALFGMVSSEVDKTMAGMRARETFGVFGVQNHLLTPRDVERD